MQIGNDTIPDPSDYEVFPTATHTERTLMTGERRFHAKEPRNNIYMEWSYLLSTDLDTLLSFAEQDAGEFTLQIDGDSYDVVSYEPLRYRRIKGPVKAFRVEWEVRVP